MNEEQVVHRMRRDQLLAHVPTILGYHEAGSLFADPPEYSGRLSEIFSEFKSCFENANEQLGAMAIKQLFDCLEVQLAQVVHGRTLEAPELETRLASLMIKIYGLDNNVENRRRFTRSTHFTELCESMMNTNFELDVEQEEIPEYDGTEPEMEFDTVETPGFSNYDDVEQWLFDEALSCQVGLLDRDGGEIPSYSTWHLLMNNNNKTQRAKSAFVMHLILIFYRHHRVGGTVDRHPETPHEDVFNDNFPALQRTINYLTNISIPTQPFANIDIIWAELTKVFIHLFMINHDHWDARIDGLVVRNATTWLLVTLIMGDISAVYPRHCVIAINTDSSVRQSIDESELVYPAECKIYSGAVYSSLSMQTGMERFIHLVPEEIGNGMRLKFEDSYYDEEE